MDPIKLFKQNILESYKILIQNARCGKQLDYSTIMDKLYLLETQGEIDNFEFIYTKLINK